MYIYDQKMEVLVVFARWCSLEGRYLYNMLELMCMFKDFNLYLLPTRKYQDLTTHLL